MNTKMTIAFIGAGNMATSLIGGLIRTEFSPEKIWASNPLSNQLDYLKNHFGIHTTANNIQAAAEADVVVLAVKPNLVPTIAQEIAETIAKKAKLVISIAAGVRMETLQKYFDKNLAIVRVMPNTPALIGCGATALFANARTSDELKDLAESMMRSVGISVWLDHEAQLDTITALSGSGPAYFFLFMEALQEAAIELGLPKKIAELFTIQTGFGATRMALESEQSLLQLRQQVTSPGGTTEQAINVFEKHGLRQLVLDALSAAKQRSEELSQP